MNKLSVATRAQILSMLCEGAHMVAIYTVWYNWVRIHKSLRVTPAMAANISDRLWTWAEIIELMDAAEPAKKRGPYKKKAAA